MTEVVKSEEPLTQAQINQYEYDNNWELYSVCTQAGEYRTDVGMGVPDIVTETLDWWYFFSSSRLTLE